MSISLWGEGLYIEASVADGTVVCLLAARVQLFADAGSIDGRIVRCGIISSYQSAATSNIVKHF